MYQEKLSVVKLEPSARFKLGVTGALQATLAAAAISMGTTYVLSIVLMILCGVGLAYVALAVVGRLPDGFPQRRNDNSYLKFRPQHSPASGQATRLHER